MSQRFQVTHFDTCFRTLRRKLTALLSESHRDDWRLQIPLWQRRYDWGEQQFETLCKDLSEATDERPVRLGTLVLAYSQERWTQDCHQTHDSSEDKAKSQLKVWIVDGQQRLRTVNNLYNFVWDQGNQSQQPFTPDLQRIQLGLYDGLNNSLDGYDLDASFRDSKHRQEFEDVFSRYSYSNPTQVNNILFHVVLVKVSDDTVTEKEFNRVLPPYFERLNRQAKPLNPEDVLKAKLIFVCREQSRQDLVHRLNCCWDRAKRLIYEPMLDIDQISDGITGSLWEQISEKKSLPACPIRTEQSRREGFCRFLLLASAFEPGDGDVKTSKPQKNELLDATYKDFVKWLARNKGIEALEFFSFNNTENFIEKFELVLNVFDSYRKYLLVSRSHLPDQTRQKEIYIDRNWQLKLLQLCCFLDAAGGGSWLANDNLLSILRELSHVSVKGTDLDPTAERAVKRIEKGLFAHLRAPESGDEPTPIEKVRDRTMLVARDWLLWQAYFPTADNEQNGKDNVYRQVVVEAFSKALDTEIGTKLKQTPEECLHEVDEAMRGYFSSTLLPSSAGAGEVEHWFALRRGDKKATNDVTENDLERSANYAFISNGLNQSLRDLTVVEKANRIGENSWPNLKFLASVTKAVNGDGGISVRDRYDKADLLLWFRMVDVFWETVQEKITERLNIENK